jgi:hypothetical protein
MCSVLELSIMDFGLSWCRLLINFIGMFNLVTRYIYVPTWVSHMLALTCFKSLMCAWTSSKSFCKDVDCRSEMWNSIIHKHFFRQWPKLTVGNGPTSPACHLVKLAEFTSICIFGYVYIFICYSIAQLLLYQIVDFSCGLNDFSQFMKEKLDTVGKRCNFKNFDVIRPKVKFVTMELF